MTTTDQYAKKWWVLFGTSLCMALAFLDQTAVIVILPTLQRELGGSNLQVQWILNAYMLTMAVLFILGGRLGDMYGQKKTFLVGMAIFAIASLLCALSSTINELIAARVLQGMGSAILVPSQSVIVLNAFPVEERGRAIGLNTGIGAIFLVTGAFIGGALTEAYSWNAVFLLNLPFCIVSAGLVFWAVRPIAKKAQHSIDWMGLLLQLIFASSLVVGIMELGHLSTSFCIGLIVLSILAFYALYQVETRKKFPLLSFHIFKIKVFMTSCLLIFFIQIILIGGIYWTVFYQEVLGNSPLIAGLMSMPSSIPVLFMAPIGGLLLDRFGIRLPLLLSLGLLIFALGWMSFFISFRSYPLLIPGLLAFGFGVPMIMSTIFTPGLNAVELHNRGLASGTLGFLRQLGASVGLAFVSVIFNLSNHAKVTSEIKSNAVSLPADVIENIFAHPQALTQLPAANQLQVLNIAKDGIAFAINHTAIFGFLVAVLLLIIGFVRTYGDPGFLKKDKA